jgi:predicted  nucleic acid-binding Zn-ribbon protein
MSCVNKKAASLSCEKSEDYMQLRKDFEELQAQYSDLEDKFKTVLESLVVKSKKKDEETVEINTNDDLIEDNTTILDKKVENPSEHIQDEKVSSKKEVKLPSFEQKIVNEYKRIKNEDGDYAANLYLNSKSFYLPKGFDPNKF